MTTNHWQMVLIISSFIAQLIAPMLAEFVKSRISQPRQTPEPNQPKNRIQRIGIWFIGFLRSPWGIPLFVILVNIYYLVWSLRNTAPITRLVILNMSLSVGAILFTFLNIMLLRFMRLGLELIEIVRNQDIIAGEGLKLVDALEERIESLEKASALAKLHAESKQGGLLKLLAAAKTLFRR